MGLGWAKIHRKIEDNPIWLRETFTKGQAWIDLILFANHQPSSFWIRGNEVKIDRGQIGWSEITMAARWRWSRNKVRRFLNWLETEQQIKQQKSPLTTVITILNYDEYQSDHKNGTAGDTTERQQTIHIQECKECKEPKPTSSKPVIDTGFDQFWSVYPKPVGKQQARKAWHKLNPNPSLITKILESVKNQMGSDQWQRDGGQYIPYPATWLNQARWEDELKIGPNPRAKLTPL